MTLKIQSLFLILAIGLLSSCEKLTGSKDDPARAIQRLPDPIPVPQPPPPLPHPEPPPPILNILPDISFAMDEYSYDGSGQVALQLNLSKGSDVPLSVDILLVDGTAIYPEDFIGFDGSSANDLKITVDIPPNTTQFSVPALLIPKTGNCDVKFTASLKKATVQQATVTKETTTIKMPCL